MRGGATIRIFSDRPAAELRARGPVFYNQQKRQMPMRAVPERPPRNSRHADLCFTVGTRTCLLQPANTIRQMPMRAVSDNFKTILNPFLRKQLKNTGQIY